MQAWAVEARKQGVLLHPSLEAAMSELATGSQRGSIESVFVIGGGQVPHVVDLRTYLLGLSQSLLLLLVSIATCGRLVTENNAFVRSPTCIQCYRATS